MNKQAKVAKVMREFKSGELKSSSGKKVTNPKQAIAIGLSEAGMSRKQMEAGGIAKKLPSSTQMGNLGMKKGGNVKESKALVKKEVSFMKKKGAPKSMIKHEMAEMKYGGKVKKMAGGGLAAGHKSADGIAMKGKTKGKDVTMKGSTGMKKGGAVKKMRYGGKTC
jgi:hypothetical protein